MLELCLHSSFVFACTLIQFADAECAKKALEQLNGFELAGRPMKVGHVTERTDASTASSFLDNDELERTGIDLGTTGRLQLMARLAEGREKNVCVCSLLCSLLSILLVNAFSLYSNERQVMS